MAKSALIKEGQENKQSWLHSIRVGYSGKKGTNKGRAREQTVLVTLNQSRV